MANFSNFYRNVRRNSRPQRKNTQTTGTLGNRIMRSSGVGASVNPLTPTKKAEQERAQRMRRGISPASYVVRSQVGRQITNAPRINKAVVTSNRLFGNLRGNALAPIKQTADYTRSQQSKYLNTDIQRKGMYTPATQLMAGKTNIGVEQGKTLRAGMMTNSPLIESWRPTSSAAEKVYRDRYGFNKEYQEALNRRLDNSSINEDVDARGTNRYDPHGDYAELSVPLPSGRAMPTAMTVQNGAGVYHVGDSLRDIKADDFRSGLADTFSSKNPEDVYRRQTGKELDEDTLQRLEQQRGTWGYNAGMMTGQMAQYGLTRGALSALGIVGKAAQAERAAKAAGNLNKARAISFGSELGIDQAASLPLNILDAFKEDNPQDIWNRFKMNQGLDVLFSGVTTGISIANNPAFKEAKALHESANELRANGNKAMADATDIAAYKKMGEVPKEEIDLAQEEIRKGYHAGDGGKSEFYRNQAGGLRDTGAYGTGTYFGGSLDIFKGTGYESRPMNEIVNLDNYNLYRPQNAEQGVRVHDNLRRINRNVEKVADDVDTLNYGGIERINDAIERPFSKENLENIEDVAKRYLSKDEIDEIENKAINQFNRQHMSEEERAAERMALANDKEYVRDLKRTLQATGMDADDDIVIEAILDDLGFDTPEKTLDEIRYDWYSDALESSYRSGSRIPTKLEEASESVRAINELSQDLGISRDVVEDALRKTAETIRGYGGVDFNKKLDSASTVFMKNLGFEGVDVTGIKGLDNTRYGSVIYDLKSDDLRRISEGKPSEPIAEEPKPTSSDDAYRFAENSAAENNFDDFKNQLFKDKQQIAAFKERGITKPEQIREFWRTQKMNGFTADDIVELPDETAISILRERFPQDYHQQWFQNENKGVKPHVEEIILSDKELRNAGLNIAYINYRDTYSTAGKMGFQEFLDTPVTLYRGWQNGSKLTGDDVFVSFTADRSVAEKMAKKNGSIEEITLRPRDTLGSYQTNGEYELLVPRSTYESASKTRRTVDEIASAETVAKEQPVAKTQGDSAKGKTDYEGQESNLQPEPTKGVKEEPKPKQEPEAEAKAEEPKAEPKQEAKQKTESPKDDLGRDVFNGGERYHPSGDWHTPKGWKAVERKYEKMSIARLRKEKMEVLPKKVEKGMDSAEAIERAKLIDSLMDEKARYRYGTLKEYNGEDISRSFDTLSHSEKTELIHDAMRRSFVDDGIDNGIRGKIGRKVGMNPEEAVELAVSRVEKNVDEVRARLSNAASEARGGEFPSEYRNSQEYYAEVLAYLEHSTSKMEELIEKGLKDSDAYRTMEKDTTNIVSGAMALRSQEGYGAVQYNLLCRSSGEVRVAIVRKAVDDINEQFEKQLEKAAKKEGKELTDADKIRVALTDDMVDRIKKVNPDSPLEMNRLLNDISREIWNQVPASGREVADSIRKTSMLLNFKTHERNFLGNAFMIPARMLKDAIGAPFEKYAVSKGKMDIIDSSKARINRFSKEYKELKKGAEQIWAEWKDFVTGNAKYFDSAIPSASKLLGKRPIGGWGNKLLTAGIENPKMWRKVGDAVINFNGALLEWSDELFLKFHFVDSVVQSCKARGLDPSNLTSEELQSVIKTATGEAQRATFRDVSDAAKLINELKSVTPNDGRFKRGVSWVADTTLPFVNVPINVGRRAWDYSPFGLGEGIATIRKAWKTGDSKQVKKAIDKMASGATGTGIFVVGILLGRSGGATATLSDGKEGYYEQDQGHQEYSLNIEGENGIDIPFIELKNEDGISISLSPFAPWSIPLFMGVEAGNAMDGGKINWSGLLDVAGGALSPMLDMSVLQGPSDILNSIRKSENAPAMFVNLILTTMTNHYMQYVPTLMGQMARIQDPVRRDTTSYQENSVMKNLDKTKLKFISKIPSTPLTDNSLYNISSTRLNPYLDAWGREQKTYEDSKAKRAAYELFSPTYVRQKNITALDDEINRLNKLAANEDEVTVPTKFFDTALSLNGEKIQIDRNDIYEYNKVKGQESYRKASKLIETDEYRNATAEEQRKMLNQVFSEAGKEAKQQTLLKKGIDEYTVYTDGFTGGKAEQAQNAKAAGIKGKDYYTLVTDKAADADGNGTVSQPEYYNYLKGKTQYTDAQKAVLWRAKNSGWKEETNPFVTGVPPKETGKTASTTNAQYTAEMKKTGLTEKQFAEVTSADTAKIDSNGSGRVSQAEYQAYLDGFSYLTNEQKSLLWKQYNPHWKKNPYDGSSTASSGSSKRSRSGRRSSGGSSKTKARAKTASEKRFAALQTGKAPTNAKGIEALSGASGLTKAQKKALVKLMQKKLDV